MDNQKVLCLINKYNRYMNYVIMIYQPCIINLYVVLICQNIYYVSCNLFERDRSQWSCKQSTNNLTYLSNIA